MKIGPIALLHKFSAVLLAVLKPLGIWGVGGLALLATFGFLAEARTLPVTGGKLIFFTLVFLLCASQLAVALMSDAANHISGQIFGAGGYNLSIFSQPRPIKTYQREGGWDADGIVKDFFPRAEKDFLPLARAAPAEAIPVPAS